MVPKFLHTLYTLLQVESPTIITWSSCGTFFQVVDVTRLEQDVLPRYFKHKKFTSFQRQLNNFGFRKWTKKQSTICTFSHDIYVRCKPSELSKLVVQSVEKRSPSHKRTRHEMAFEPFFHKKLKEEEIAEERESAEVLLPQEQVIGEFDPLSTTELGEEDINDWHLLAKYLQ